MGKVIIFDNGQGGVAVMRCADNVYVLSDTKDLSREKFVTFENTPSEEWRKATIEEIAARDVPNGVTWKIVDEAEIPQDRYFRNAWKQDRASVSIDMDKAREVHKNILREKRAKYLEKLDQDYMRADEAGDIEKKKSIASLKQALRDITSHPEISSAKTPEELKVAALSIISQ